MFAVSRFTVNKKAQMFHSYSEIWLFAPSVCLVSLLTRKPRCLLVSLLTRKPRSFCVSRFTVNKKAQKFARHTGYCNVEPVFGGLWARNVSIGGRAVADRKRGNEIVLSNTTH